MLDTIWIGTIKLWVNVLRFMRGSGQGEIVSRGHAEGNQRIRVKLTIHSGGDATLGSMQQKTDRFDYAGRRAVLEEAIQRDWESSRRPSEATHAMGSQACRMQSSGGEALGVERSLLSK
ncbi:hypothetical protein VNO78_15874 [Psophocarpus tetragonolobus]|uniref:Uncharacterized protein n=1 Tax=Psophocarpus tetragonolobus TaxID=3891 RepID=A0AAN9XKA9_PSOTE